MTSSAAIVPVAPAAPLATVPRSDGAAIAPWKAQRKLLMPSPAEWEQIRDMCTFIAQSHLGPEDVRGNPAKIVTVVLKGWELGLAPMQALDGIHIIKGRTELSADLKAALAQQRVPGAKIEWLKDGTERDGGEARVRCVRPGRRDVVLSYTREEADRDGLTKRRDRESGSMVEKEQWAAYGPAMLRAFCLRNACKMQYPEIEYGFDAAEYAAVEQEAAGRAEVEPVAAAAPAQEPTLTDPPTETIEAQGEVVESPADATLPFSQGPYKDKRLSELGAGDFKRLADGYRKAAAEAAPDKKADKEKWLSMVLAWAKYRGVEA